MQRDPHQLNNLLDADNAKAATHFTIAGRSLDEIVIRLDALVLVLKSCKREACTHPWRVLHPEGDVDSLTDSLQKRYDAFYAEQPKVSFSRCERGFIKEAEGPLVPNRYSVGQEYGADALREQQASFQYSGPIGWWT